MQIAGDIKVQFPCYDLPRGVLSKRIQLGTNSHERWQVLCKSLIKELLERSLLWKIPIVTRLATSNPSPGGSALQWILVHRQDERRNN